MTSLITRALRSRAGRAAATPFRLGPAIAVDAAAGRVLIRRPHGIDGELVRVHDSSLVWRSSCVGGGWMLSCDERIEERDGDVAWSSGDGLVRVLCPGQAGRWIVRDDDGGVCWRERDAWIVETGDRRLRLERARAAGTYLLTGGTSADGALQVTRDPSDRATGFRAPTGALHRLEHDARGRLVRTWVEGNVRASLLAFEHEGDRLARVRDARGRVRDEYEHDGMLLVAARFDGTTRTLFEYDGRDEHARCTRVWTEDGEIDLALHHRDDRTLVEERGRGVWEVHCDARRRPTRIVDPSRATIALTWAGDRIVHAASGALEWRSENAGEARATHGALVAERRRVGDTLVEIAWIDDRQLTVRASAAGRPSSVAVDGRCIAELAWWRGQLTGARIAGREIVFEHDASGRWVGATGPTTVSAARDDDGRILGLEWGDLRLARTQAGGGLAGWHLLRDGRERARVTQREPGRVELVIDERSLEVASNRRGERTAMLTCGGREIALVRDDQRLVAMVDGARRLEIERDRAGRARILRSADLPAARIARDGSGRIARIHHSDGRDVEVDDAHARRLRHVVDQADRPLVTWADVLDSLGVLLSAKLVESPSDLAERMRPEPDDWTLLPDALLPWRGLERAIASAPLDTLFEMLVLDRPSRPTPPVSVGPASPGWLPWLRAWASTSELAPA